jgi:hypothetical protein
MTGPAGLAKLGTGNHFPQALNLYALLKLMQAMLNISI